MSNKSGVASAVRWALAAGTAVAIAGNVGVAQQADASLQEVVVTGSRIKRENIEEAALPVTVITRVELEESGETSVADYIRDLPFNSFGSLRQGSGSSAQSFAGISLRGLGEGRTLILIDGRRAPTAPNVGSAQDLNSIPLAAVERIEVLTNGASAIYGSDAIGGVINIITRRDFNGVQAMIGASDPERAGGETEEGSLIFGASGERASLLAGVSHIDRAIVFQRDRDYSFSDSSISSFSNEFYSAIPTGVGPYGFRAGSRYINPTFGSAVPGGCDGRGFVQAGSGASTRCFYNYSLEGAYEAAVSNTAIFARGQYEITDDWTTYLNSSIARVKSFGRYAPVPSSPWPGGSIFVPRESPNHPANRFPDAGYPDEPLFMRHRFAALGNRDTFTDANTYLFEWGVDGRLGNFDINAGVRRADSQYYDLGRNYVVGGLAQQQISSGAYDIYDPFDNPRSVLDSMIATINRDAKFVSKELYMTVSTELFELPAGSVGIAVGAEYREEEYKDIYDTLSSSGQIVGSAGNSAFGGRSSKAYYAEVSVPIAESFEASLAVRNDRYSDYGDDTSPQIALRWSVLDSLILRASYGEGFRAPTLDIVSAQPSFDADGVADPQTCTAFGLAPTCTTQVTTYRIANPNIESETSEQFSFGVVWDPLDWLNVKADYWNIKLTNQVSFISIGTIIRCLELGTGICPSGLSFLPVNAVPPDASLGLGFARAPAGEILYGQTGFANLGFTETDGVDLNVRAQFDLGGWGRINSQLLMSRTLNYSGASGVNVVDQPSVPEQRGTLSNTWTYGDFSLTWNMNYIASTQSSQALFIDAFGPDADYGYALRLPSWVTHDLQLNWQAPWNGRVTLGALNVADKDPVTDPFDPTGEGYDQDLYNGYGRMLYFRVMQNF